MDGVAAVDCRLTDFDLPAGRPANTARAGPDFDDLFAVPPAVEARGNAEPGPAPGGAPERPEADLVDGRVALLAELEQALAGQRRDLEIRHAEEFAAYRDQLAKVTAQAVAAGLGRIENELNRQIAVLVGPLLVEEVKDRSLRQLDELMSRLVGGAQGLSCKLCAPAELLESLQKELEARSLTVTSEVASGLDFTVTFEQTTIASNLEMWLDDLRKAAHI